jgi:hypothetical protein
VEYLVVVDILDVVDAFTFELTAASLTFAAICLGFCSNVLAVFDIYLETSFVYCRTGFHASRVEKITLFESLIADTVLSATVLTNVVYALTAASGVQKLVTNPLKASLYGLHADWSELTTCF